MRTTGKYFKTIVTGEEAAAFIPAPLPPTNPELLMDQEATHLLQRAEHALSHLALTSEMVPSIGWFIYGFVRKEAVISSHIEGTQTTLVTQGGLGVVWTPIFPIVSLRPLTKPFANAHWYYFAGARTRQTPAVACSFGQA